MSIERPAAFDFKGARVTIVGADLQAGEPAPEFRGQKPDWSMNDALASTQGKVRIIGSLPSINTSVCDRETRYFNEVATAQSDDIVILMVSMDLPYSQKNWCAAAGVDNVDMYSDHLEGEFGAKYGVLLKEVRLLRRAIFVVDRNGKIAYADYMPTFGDEPDYDAVLEAARQAL